MNKYRSEHYRQYYAANREKILARCREWRKRNLEKRRAVEAAWRKANPQKCKEKYRRYRLKHLEERRAKAAEYAKKRRRENPEKVREMDRRKRAREKARMAADPALYRVYRALKNAAKKRYDATFATDAARYARDRANKRKSHARRRIAAGKTYKPMPNRRTPDWACKGERTLDARSAFLAVNQTASQRAFARELQKKRMA